jgi:hypothetical protein
MRVLPSELDVDVDVDFCCVKDVVELESVVLDPTGEPGLPSNWVNMAVERTAIAMTRRTKVDRFLAELITAYFSPVWLAGRVANGEETFKFRSIAPSILEVETGEPNPGGPRERE